MFLEDVFCVSKCDALQYKKVGIGKRKKKRWLVYYLYSCRNIPGVFFIFRLSNRHFDLLALQLMLQLWSLLMKAADSCLFWKAAVSLTTGVPKQGYELDFFHSDLDHEYRLLVGFFRGNNSWFVIRHWTKLKVKPLKGSFVWLKLVGTEMEQNVLLLISVKKNAK